VRDWLLKAASKGNLFDQEAAPLREQYFRRMVVLVKDAASAVAL
jgi:hypothetical protein